MDFTELKDKVDRIPEDAGTKDKPIIFHIGPGAKPESYAFYLQYGQKIEGKYQRFRMRIRQANSEGCILECNHSRNKGTKCKGRVKLQVLDPKKMLNCKFVTQGVLFGAHKIQNSANYVANYEFYHRK